MEENDDVKKIDEQIENIEESVKEEEFHTKKLDKIDDLETETIPDEEESTEIEKTKEEVVEEEKKEEATKEVPKKDDKKKNIILILSLCVGIIALIFLVVFIIKMRTSPKSSSSVTPKKNLTEADKKEIINEYGDALKGLVQVYLTEKELLLAYDDAILLVKYDYDVICDEHEIYEDGSLYLNKCSINEKSVKYSYGKKKEKEELKEGAIKVYVYKKNKNATLEEPSDLKDYDVYSFDIEGKYSELNLLGEKSDYVFYRDEKYNGQMFNYKTRTKALKSIDYTSIAPIKYNDKYDQEYVTVLMNDKNGVYKLDTEEASVPVKYTYFMSLTIGVSGPTASITAVNDGVVGVALVENAKAKYGAINYRTNKTVIPVEYKRFSKSGKYIIAVDDYDVAHILTTKGNEILKDRYDEIYTIVDGKYVLAREGKEIIIATDEGRELYSFGKIKVGRFNYAMAYKGGAAFMFDNINDPESAQGNCIELIYDSDTKEGTTKETVCGGIAKPMLYLYPEKTTKVTVEFEYPEYIETSYPKFVNRWEVTAKKNGDLRDSNKKYYYGLYWDEKKVHTVDFSEGFYVEKEDAITFLEEKLSYIGLNDREKNEFITYWLPILEKNGKNVVYFELTDERESVNKIYITPKPDSLLRIVIHVKKVDEKVSIKEEKLTKFKRSGFAAVEWGGTTY